MKIKHFLLSIGIALAIFLGFNARKISGFNVASSIDTNSYFLGTKVVGGIYSDSIFNAGDLIPYLRLYFDTSYGGSQDLEYTLQQGNNANMGFNIGTVGLSRSFYEIFLGLDVDSNGHFVVTSENNSDSTVITSTEINITAGSINAYYNYSGFGITNANQSVSETVNQLIYTYTSTPINTSLGLGNYQMYILETYANSVSKETYLYPDSLIFQINSPYSSTNTYSILLPADTISGTTTSYSNKLPAINGGKISDVNVAIYDTTGAHKGDTMINYLSATASDYNLSGDIVISSITTYTLTATLAWTDKSNVSRAYTISTITSSTQPYNPIGVLPIDVKANTHVYYYTTGTGSSHV